MPRGTESEPGPFSIELAAILRGHLARQQQTKQALADAVGMSRPQMSKVLAGKKQMDVEELDRVCWALGLNAIDVITQADEATPNRHVEPEWDTDPL